MKANAEITKDRNLEIHVDLSQENQSSALNAWVSHIEIFNTNSYLDGICIYQKDYDNSSNMFPTDGLVLSEHDLNLFDTLVNEESCHTTDLLNDIIIINLAFEYNTTYEANHTCNELVRTTTMSLYYPCPLYQNAMSAMQGCSCKDMCEENLPYGFMYALLKKKAIDCCLGAGHYDQACRYFNKFFRNDPCNCVKKDCGCGSGSSNNMVASSSATTTKNCGCHG